MTLVLVMVGRKFSYPIDTMLVMSLDPEKQRAAKRRYYEKNRDVYRAKNKRKRKRMHD